MHELRAGHLVAVVQIVHGVEDRVGVVDIDDLAVRKHLLHAGDEDLPLLVPWKSSHMKKPPRSRYSRILAAWASVRFQWPTSTA